jgi:flavin reductase (DIM6/NTAB) family NADH-FMN oxidoreductase RutF
MNADEQFNGIAAQLNYPMLIATAASGTEMSGCLVGFHTQCSIKPPRMLVCISRRNRTCTVATRSDLLGVHFLDVADHALSVLFGEETGHTTDKFTRCEWQRRHGIPILTKAKAWLIGGVLERVDLGDHIGHLLEPLEAHMSGELDQLSFQQVTDMKPGNPA